MISTTMTSTLRAARIWILAALVCGPAAAQVAVGWKDKEATTAKLHVGLPAPALEAITRWAPFCEARGYRMDLDAQGRVLVVTRAKRGRTKETLRIVGAAQTWFDGVLPPVPRASAEPAAAPGGASPGGPAPGPRPAPLPEDPEDPPAPRPSSGTGVGPRPGGAEAPAPKTAWGSGSGAPDSQTATLFLLHDEVDHAAFLDHLEASVPHLQGWIATARKQTGLTLEDPLVGAFVENASGQEEWNGDHEILNRVVQLLVLRRFGQQPNWLVQGLAWEAEMAHDGSVYCFPYRDGFVFATEHTSWPSDLRIAFKDRSGRPLAVEELARWPRGVWDGEAAPVAWGFVRFLCEAQKTKDKALSRLLEEFRRIRDEQDREPTGPTTWRRIEGWSMDPKEQEAALTAVFGPDVWKRATAALRTLKDVAGSRSADTKAKSRARDSSGSARG
ncbi:MAG: hypothetical protein JNK02_14280 [Planctomycetes bacterium]|nr:hypothetical protein [Planctomycetota bacterium]